MESRTTCVSVRKKSRTARQKQIFISFFWLLKMSKCPKNLFLGSRGKWGATPAGGRWIQHLYKNRNMFGHRIQYLILLGLGGISAGEYFGVKGRFQQDQNVLWNIVPFCTVSWFIFLFFWNENFGYVVQPVSVESLTHWWCHRDIIKPYQRAAMLPVRTLNGIPAFPKQGAGISQGAKLLATVFSHFGAALMWSLENNLSPYFGRNDPFFIFLLSPIFSENNPCKLFSTLGWVETQQCCSVFELGLCRTPAKDFSWLMSGRIMGDREVETQVLCCIM